VKTREILSGAGFLAAILAGSGIATATPTQVAVQVFQFRPGQLEVKAGTRVTWTNGDDITHTVTSGAPEQRDGRFAERLEGRERLPRPAPRHTTGAPDLLRCRKSNPLAQV
jgi:plastocyanin